jgi:[citrate (pro-3S)-lyase] ligase
MKYNKEFLTLDEKDITYDSLLKFCLYHDTNQIYIAKNNKIKGIIYLEDVLANKIEIKSITTIQKECFKRSFSANKSQIEEFNRLLKENKDIIKRRYEIQGYRQVITANQELVPIDELNISLLDTHKSLILCLYETEVLKKIKQRYPMIKYVSLVSEYNRMYRQVEKISLKSLKLYADLFGYTEIKLFGDNLIFKEINSVLNKNMNSKEIKNNDILYITEYLDDDNQGRLNGQTIGIVQFLYEIEVISDIPEIILDKIKKENFITFILRFLTICAEDGWSVIFSKKTRLILDLLQKSSGISSIVFLNDTAKTSSDKPLKNKIILVKNGALDAAEEFYNENKRKYRIERRRFIVLFRTWIMENICCHFQKTLEKENVSLYMVNCNWGLNHYLFPKKFITSEDIENREAYNLYHIKKNPVKYKDFIKDIYGGNVSDEFVQEIMDIPPKIEVLTGNLKHDNKAGKNLNVLNGERFTTNQPEDAENTIYLFGGCVFFGYAIDDKNTVASFLQRKLNKQSDKKKWKVINYATWGGNIDQTYRQLYNIKFKTGDIVIISYAGYMPLGLEYKEYDISKGIANLKINNNFYFNGVVHCNAQGYEAMADSLYRIIQNNKTIDCHEKKYFYLEDTELQKKELLDEKLYRDLMQYINDIKCNYPLPPHETSKGAIVMNCNPFTNGHKYLIENAAKQVDYLYIFVVEEDKSYFKFKDRYELVKEGTSEIKNVIVVPSGNLIISSITFPGYFLKDTPDRVTVDTSLDLSIFAKYIAAELGINKRFVGEEPFDIVTRKYNETMKLILPRYGIDLIEIPRKESGNSAISASRVRKLLEMKKFDSIKKLVPETTFQFLVKNFQ